MSSIIKHPVASRTAAPTPPRHEATVKPDPLGICIEGGSPRKCLRAVHVQPEGDRGVRRQDVVGRYPVEESGPDNFQVVSNRIGRFSAIKDNHSVSSILEDGLEEWVRSPDGVRIFERVAGQLAIRRERIRINTRPTAVLKKLEASWRVAPADL